MKIGILAQQESAGGKQQRVCKPDPAAFIAIKHPPQAIGAAGESTALSKIEKVKTIQAIQKYFVLRTKLRYSSFLLYRQNKKESKSTTDQKRNQRVL